MTCRSLPFLSSMCSFRQGYSPTGVVGCCRNYGARAFRLVLPSTPRCDNRGTYSPAAIGISDSHLRRTLISSLLCYGMQTPQGKTLLAMVDEGLPQDAIEQSASVQLDTLLPVRSLTSLSYNQDVQPSKGMLQRRIEEVKSKEKDEIVQEIIYALVASKLLSAISRTPEEDASHLHSSLCSSIHPLSIQDVLIMQQRQQLQWP
ncbi:hypothetical protein KP509_09G001200 [Ceratopteris richardii]|uniref:Uncharacterized protein n=1 Tax=Ceratopteris richardii TaxID=49495 RepID=A0A8T2TY55_CERRI|nr:hypothetical protein KP509_09G001200 [Ceratopteris richardii]